MLPATIITPVVMMPIAPARPPQSVASKGSASKKWKERKIIDTPRGISKRLHFDAKTTFLGSPRKPLRRPRVRVPEKVPVYRDPTSSESSTSSESEESWAETKEAENKAKNGRGLNKSKKRKRPRSKKGGVKKKQRLNPPSVFD